MNGQKFFCIAILAVFLAGGGLFFTVSKANAEPKLLLSAEPIAQRFSPTDPNGDAGFANCMPAALTVALQTLSQEGQLIISKDKITYANVRSIVRSFMPDPRRGIAPNFLVAATPIITDNAFTLSFITVDSNSWRDFIAEELKKGYPVIVHIQDRNSLYNPVSQTALSHVVVVYGIDETSIHFTDSWDGQAHTTSLDRFGYVWGKGNYKWLAFTFHRQEPLTSFKDIMKERFFISS